MEGYKVLKCGSLYVKEIIFDGYDKLHTLQFSESITDARRILLTDNSFDGIEKRYEFIQVKTIKFIED